MNIEVSILDATGDELVLLVKSYPPLELGSIDNAFEDGLRNHSVKSGCLVEAQRTIRKSADGNFLVTCKPYYRDNKSRTDNTIKYELQFHLRHPDNEIIGSH